MPKPSIPTRFRIGSALALVLVIAGCTKAGQFDPTEIFNSDAFDNKKKLQGQREPVFPSGVPGVETGVPPDLVKGYQPPPDQAAPNSAVAPAPAAAAEKPKPKPKPKLARAAPPPRARIEVQPTAAAPQPPASSQTVWPAPAPATSAQSSQSVWPSPAPAGQQTAQPGQPAWPNSPPPAATSR